MRSFVRRDALGSACRREGLLADAASGILSQFLRERRGASHGWDREWGLLLHGDKGSLHLRPALTGVRWAWQTCQGSDGTIVRPDDPSQYTVEFLPDGTLAIQVDCHHAVGTYTVDNSTVDLRIGERTTAICPPGALMDRFLRDLDQVTSHVFRGGKLYLALPMDAGVHAFAPNSVAPPAATPATGLQQRRFMLGQTSGIPVVRAWVCRHSFTLAPWSEHWAYPFVSEEMHRVM